MLFKLYIIQYEFPAYWNWIVYIKKKKKTFISQKNVLEEERKNIKIIKFKVKNLKNPFINGKIKR